MNANELKDNLDLAAYDIAEAECLERRAVKLRKDALRKIAQASQFLTEAIECVKNKNAKADAQPQ